MDEQIGLEETPEEYIAKLVDVFREVRRVLRDDGTLWLVLGDSYGGKQLRMIPARVALALQADGWCLRSEIVWTKPNPRPENVTDRPTAAHEKLFLLTKQASYYYDAEAIREPGKDWSKGGPGVGIEQTQHYGANNGGNAGLSDLAQRYRDGKQDSTRNKRNVWEIPTMAVPGAHFAVFPTALVEPCLLAGSRSGDAVLDPFTGSGTVGVVCEWYGRDFVGIELNPEYVEMARQRIDTVLRRRPKRPKPKVVTTSRSALQHAIATGLKLVEMKALVKADPKGRWLPWLEANFPGSRQTADNYMRLAENCQHVGNFRTVREALAEVARREAEQSHEAGAPPGP